MYAFLNAIPYGTSVANTYNLTNNPIILGLGPAGTDNTDAYIDMVKIYNQALTSKEILDNYNAIKSRFGH